MRFEQENKNEKGTIIMEFEALIEKRRSVRAYDPEKRVTSEQVEQVIQAAIQAPSWKNLQTSRYYAILDAYACKKFAENCLPAFNIKNSVGASLIVTTFISGRVGFDRETGKAINECENGWGFYDLGLQSENLILKAKELGLDTLIMGIRDGEKIRELLQIPAEESVVSVIAIGYGMAEPAKPKRKTPEDILKFVNL